MVHLILNLQLLTELILHHSRQFPNAQNTDTLGDTSLRSRFVSRQREMLGTKLFFICYQSREFQLRCGNRSSEKQFEFITGVLNGFPLN